MLASTYLRTSVPRKHLLKPTSFQTPCVHFHADSVLLVPHREGRSNNDSLVRVIGTRVDSSTQRYGLCGNNVTYLIKNIAWRN